MKLFIFFKNIVFIWIIVFSADLHSQDSITLSVIPSGQYTFSDWNNYIGLWTATINGDLNKNYYIEMKFYIGGTSEPDIWGISEKYSSPLTNNNFSYENMLDLCNGRCYSQSDDFINSIENTGSLPYGDYKIEYILWENLELYSEFLGNENFIDAKNQKSLKLDSRIPLYSNYAQMHNENVTFINLVEPLQNTAVNDPNPWFRWDSPGFSVGIKINYRLRVYLFNPQFHSTYTDAVEDDNYLYFDSGWDDDNIVLETGISQQLSLQYSSNNRELECGFKFIWFVEARDVSFDASLMDEGLWGWPDPISSPLSMFSYGENITANSVVSPPISNIIESVRPTFHIEPINCASSYEIWLSEAEDSEIENPIWASGDLPSNINVYPLDAIGLAPNKNYKWKIRVNPDGEPSPWSEAFDFSISGYSLDEPSSGQILNTVTPTFYFSGPSDIAGYELRISNNDDPLVESGNIFSENVPSFPFELPLDIQEGLLPGKNYFWKLIFLDGNENIVGEMDDYTNVESFSISEIQVNSPSDGATDLSLTPSFMWDGPIGVGQYEFMISYIDDPSIESPFYTTQIGGTFFQYPQYGDPPLEFGSLYYWKIVPLDANENRGVSSDLFSFSTAVDGNTISEEATSTKPEFSISNGPESSPRNIIVNLLANVTGADAYTVFFSEDQEMGSIFEEQSFEDNQTELVLNGDELEWGMVVYVQIHASFEDELIGEKSSIQIINLPEKPGSDDQVGINVSLEDGSTKPIIEIINQVTNAIDYLLIVATDSEMSEVLVSISASSEAPTVYPETEVSLIYGQTYYIQVSAMDNDGAHGIPSSVTAIFIPNITPPEIQEQFSWEATIPAVNLYNIQISTTDDFSSIVIDATVDDTSYLLTDDLNPGTMYYWRIQGFQDNGEAFGGVSSTHLFETEGEPVELEEVEGGQVVIIQSPASGEELSTLRPSFQWEPIEVAEKYEIRIASNEDYSQIMWQSPNIAQSSVQYPSSGSEILIAEVVYYWSVRAISGDIALGEFCESFMFTVSEDNTPILAGPMDGLSESILPYFSWGKIPRATSYGLILGSNEDCSQLIFENQSISEKQFQYTSDSPPLDYDTSYYWKVISYDENGTALGDYSLIATFKTPDGIVEIEFIYEEGDE